MATTNLQRTAEELKNPDLNYFIAFKIDLKEIDKAKIEQNIKIELGKASGSIVQRRLLELKDDIMQVMCNDAVFNGAFYEPNKGARKKEAEAAKAFKIKKTVDMIRTLCKVRKTLFKSELLTIYFAANKSATYFTEEEFFQAIGFLSGLGVKIIDNTDEKIPFDKFQRTDKLLEPLRKRDLYDYLGLDKTASLTVIQDTARTVYQESQKTSDLKKKQSGSQLAKTVEDTLCDQQVRKAYDQYIAIKSQVWDEFAQRKDFGIKEMTISEYEEYTQTIISQLKISIEEAEKILAIGCKYFQLTIVAESNTELRKGNVEAFRYCPFCGHGLNESAGYVYCPYCGEHLR